MKILHTSDWHLGKRLEERDRFEEQSCALDWLYSTIVAHEIDTLLVAGDIFDTRQPPNEARQLYYRFLSRLIGTNCRQVVIVAGNHDSPAMLEADSDLLAFLNIYVVGSAKSTHADALLTLRNAAGEPELLVAAVPFLSMGDLLKTSATDTIASRYVAIQAGIKTYYDGIAAAARPLKMTYNVPLIATGHLFASYADDNKAQKSRIYVGNLENIAAADFDPIFDYVALGHVHKAQALLPKVRYSGSLIPLSFSEIKSTKQVFIIDTQALLDAKTDFCTALEVPLFRKLLILSGSLADVQAAIAATEPAETGFYSWLDIRIDSPTVLPSLNHDLRAFTADMPIEILKTQVILPTTSTEKQSIWQNERLANLDVEAVFLKKCAADGIESPEEIEELKTTFKELWSIYEKN